MLSVVAGLVVSGLSVWGMICWRQELAVVAKGFFPICFFLGGVVAVIAGASSLGRKPPSK